MSTHPVLIAGGGIAGLASALGLVRGGREVRLFERAPLFETVGAGLQIGPNAVKALKHLDAWDAVAAASFSPPHIAIRDGHSGRLLQQILLGADFERRFGEPYRVIHRADLLAGLAERAKAHAGIDLVTSAEVKSFADKGVYVTVETAKESQRGEALIGADGIRSSIRSDLLGDGPPQRRNQILFRALTSFGPALPEHLACISLWLCRNGHVVHYPVRGGKALNIVAAANGRWENDEWSAPADRQEVMAHFSTAHRELFDVLAVTSPWHKWAAADRDPAANWSRNRVTLAGDAAHAALPYLAQGAAMALEDAVILSRSAGRSDSIAEAFSNYEDLRKARTVRIAADSRKLGGVYHAGGIMGFVRNAVLRMIRPAGFLDRLAWIYDFDPSVD